MQSSSERVLDVLRKHEAQGIYMIFIMRARWGKILSCVFATEQADMACAQDFNSNWFKQ
jgi:hypothetical protein